MNAGPSSDLPQRDDLDPRHEAVERLLGRAPMPEPDAWFAARTLARCRSEKQEAVSLTRIWRWALGSGLGVCLAVGLLVVQVKQVPQANAPSADQQKSVQEAFEIMASSDSSDNDSTSPLRFLHVMARLLPSEARFLRKAHIPRASPAISFRCAVALGLLVNCSLAGAAEPATNAPSGKPPAPKPAVATAKPPATNAPPLPPGMQNTLSRYGNIVTPGDQAAYPLRLRLPYPNEGEVRIPKPDDLNKRAKIEALANLSDDDIRKQLAAWPAYTKMSLHDQGSMLQRIQDFRDYHARIAMQKARDMGLSTLTPPQQAKFEKEYWDQRLKLDQDLAKQFQPIYQAREQTMNDQLFREFSSAMPAPAPPAPKPAPKPATPPAQAQPLASTTNAAPMVGQAPR